MAWSADQRRIVRDSLLAIAFCALVLAAGIVWLPVSLFGLEGHLGPAEYLVVALRAEVWLLLWLAICVRAVSKGRFRSLSNIAGSASGQPRAALAVHTAVFCRTPWSRPSWLQMHQKSFAGRWQQYLRAKVSVALTRRAAIFLFVLAFVAVYREVIAVIAALGFYLNARGSRGRTGLGQATP